MNLVTGATGLVGSHLVLQLILQGQKVIAAKQANSNVQEVEKLFSFYARDKKELFLEIIWKEINFDDVLHLDEILESVTTVYHCAALVSLSNAQKENLLKINVDGTANLVNACLKNNISSFCFVSSIATLQNKDKRSSINEDVFWKSGLKPSAYSLSKYLAEQEVWRAMEEGLNAVIVNPGIILGVGNWNRGTGRFFSESAKGIKFYTEGESGFVAAIDVAKIMIKLVHQKKYGQRFILVENNYSYKFILNKIHSEFGIKLPKLKAGKYLLMMGRIITVLLPKNFRLNRAIINSLIDKSSYSNHKIKTTIAYDFMPIEECISQAAQAFKSAQLDS